MGNAANQSKDQLSLTGEKAYNITLDEANKLGEGSFAAVYKMQRKFDG